MDDALLLLRLQLEWGADEALEPLPLDRLTAPRRSEREAPSVAAPPLGIAARAAAIAAAPVDLDGLRAALAGFDLCPLRDTAGHLVFADGPEHASLMVVVEAPGSDDDATGVPLSGRLGRLFDAMLASIGLSRDLVRIGCLVPWRPPGGRPPTAVEIAACRPFLLAHIGLLPAVTHLVLLGSTVARAVAGAEGNLRALRGRWLEMRSGERVSTGLVMAPLDLIAADGKQKAAAWTDLIRLKRALDAASGSRLGEG